MPYDLAQSTNLYPHQKQFIRWASRSGRATSRSGGILAADMGTGKTVMALALSRDSARTLIVVPASLLDQWAREASSRFTLKASDILIFHGPNRNRLLDQNRAIIILTSPQTLRRSVDIIARQQFDYLIVDEAHEMRNPKTKIYDALLSINARKRWLLTGTPAINGYKDIIALAGLLMIEPYNDAQWFKNASDEERSVWRRETLYKIDKESVLDLPPKTQQTIVFTLDEEQRKAYKFAEDSEHANALVRMLRLRQAVLLDPVGSVSEPNPDSSVRSDESGPVSQKYRIVAKIIDESPSDECFLIFCSFRQAIEQLSDYLETVSDRPLFLFHGQMNKDARARALVGFNEQIDCQIDEGCGPVRKAPVFLISLKAGGTGLNLVRANHVILLDPYWNLPIETQAIDRAHRIGQTRPVTVTRIIAKDTIEQRIIDVQNTKIVEINSHGEKFAPE